MCGLIGGLSGWGFFVCWFFSSSFSVLAVLRISIAVLLLSSETHLCCLKIICLTITLCHEMKRVQNVLISHHCNRRKKHILHLFWESWVSLKVHTLPTSLLAHWRWALLTHSSLFPFPTGQMFISHSRSWHMYVAARTEFCYRSGRVIRVNTGRAQNSCDGLSSELPNIGICFEGFLDPKSLCYVLLRNAHPNLNVNANSVLAVQHCLQQKQAIGIRNRHPVEPGIAAFRGSSSELFGISCYLVGLACILTYLLCFWYLSKQKFLWMFKNRIGDNNVGVWLEFLIITWMVMKVQVLLFEEYIDSIFILLIKRLKAENEMQLFHSELQLCGYYSIYFSSSVKILFTVLCMSWEDWFYCGIHGHT